MNELLKINYDTETPTVSARDLHEQLHIKQRSRTGSLECVNMALKMEKTLAQK